MSKSTILLLTLAALGIGSLIGVSLVDDGAVQESAESVQAAVPTSTGGAPVIRYLGPDNVTLEHDQFGQALPSASGENFISRDGEWKSETLTIELPMDGMIEYKAMMSQGDSIVFKWSTDGGQAYYDFHAHDPSFGDEFFTRYDEGEGVRRSGTIVAPYAGQHGWFWLNLEGTPMTITLEVAGFFDEVVKIDADSY